METYIVGAHNAFSAYPPVNKLMWLAMPVWRCQNKQIPQLISEGVRFFDLRVCYRNRVWYGAHGKTTLNVQLLDMIGYIGFEAPGSIIRLILEKGGEAERNEFKNLCCKLESRFKMLEFIGGNYKPTWEKLYRFHNDSIGDEIEQRVGSMASSGCWYGRIWPWLWSKFHPERKTSLLSGMTYLIDFL